MELLQLTLFLLLCAAALGWIARRLDFPYPIALVIGGGLLSFIPRLPQFPFDPQLLLLIVLPPVLYQAALLTSWRDFRANAQTITLLAIGLVIATALAVGAALKLLIPEVPWAVAFVLGAIVSPPDAVAATAILSRLHIPRRIVTVLEGESLVNDASGLVLYKFALAAALTGGFSLIEASAQFIGVAAGGIALGAALAQVFVFIHRRLGDTFTEVLTSLLIPYIVYMLAESLRVSGVLAVVTAGLVRGRHSPEIVSAEMRILARSVWNILVFMLNSLVFILIGIQLSAILSRLSGFSARELSYYGVLITAVAIAVRFAWIYPASFLPRALRGSGERDASAPSEAELFIMSWCGMRGIVSLAAALALPIALNNGDPFPYRDLVIFLTFFVIAVTLVLQGLTLRPLVRFLKVGTDWSVQDETQRARFAMAKAAIAAVDEIARREGIGEDLAERVRAEFAEKATLAVPSGLVVNAGGEPLKRLRRAALAAERRELIRIWREHQISDEVLHRLEEALDYQELHP